MGSITVGPWDELAREQGLKNSVDDLIRRCDELTDKYKDQVVITGLDAVERNYLVLILNHVCKDLREKAHPENSYGALIAVAQKIIIALGHETL